MLGHPVPPDLAAAALDLPPARVRVLLDSLKERPLADLLGLLEKEYLIQLHADRAGDLAAMAAELGITVRALYVRFRRLGIRRGELA